MLNDSAHKLWHAFLGTHPEVGECLTPKVLQIETHEKEGARKLERILKGKTKGVSVPLLTLQKGEESLPSVGAFRVVLDGNGLARAIIQTTSVRLRPLFGIPMSFIELEGEGFNSHEAWEKGVWDRFSKDLQPFGKKLHSSTIVVCEEFKLMFSGK